MSSHNSDLAGLASKVEELVTRGLVPFDHPGGGKAVIVPDDHTLEHLRPDQPEYISSAPEFYDVESFVDYVNAFKGASTRLFASEGNFRISAVLDYHTPGAEGAHSVGKLSHKAILQLTTSPQLDAWAGISGRPQGQIHFADFVEEHIDDILEPEGAVLYDMITNFSQTRTVKFQSKIKRANSAQVISYADEDNVEGSTRVPERLTLDLPFFTGDPNIQLGAFVRTEVDRGALHVTVKLHKLEQVRRAAFRAACLRVSAATALKVAHGSVSRH